MSILAKVENYGATCTSSFYIDKSGARGVILPLNLLLCVCKRVYFLEKMLAIQKFLSGLLSHFRILVD
jgi:hypothetical protein